MRMFSAIAACAAMVMLSVPAMSGSATTIAVPQDGDAIILPQGSPLHFRAFGAEAAAEFDGAIEVSGTWYYGDKQIDDGDTGLSFYFVPDKTSLARLPRYKLRGQPTDIYLTNTGDLLNKVVTNADRAKVAKKGAKYLSGRIDIWVDKFEAGIECDAPYFNAHFLRIAQPPTRVALTNMPDEGC